MNLKKWVEIMTRLAANDTAAKIYEQEIKKTLERIEKI